jgi:hypothetical protein
VLPRIVEDLYSDYVSNGKLHFTVQSNFAFDRLERHAEVVVARATLEGFGSENVKLIYAPMQSAEYVDTLLRAHIALLPYDPRNYYARSSGALVECLSAGIPVVVPSSSWLSRVISGENYRYLQGVGKGSYGVTTHVRHQILWFNASGEATEPLVEGELSFGGKSARTFTSLAVPPASSRVKVSFEATELTLLANATPTVRVSVEFLGPQSNVIGRDVAELEARSVGYPAGCMFSVTPGAARMRLGLENAHGDSPLTITHVEIDFVTGACPLGVVGLTYATPDQSSERLREIVNEYAHYRQSAIDLSTRIRQEHNPDRVIEQLRFSQPDPSLERAVNV